MAEKDDPFLEPDDEKTIIKPSPGGRPRSTATREPQPGPTTPGARVELQERDGLNPLERSAAILLNILSQIRNTGSHPDPEGLHRQLAEEIERFEKRAQSEGVPPETIYIARYALCSTIDEFVMGTPWGANSIFSRQSLLSLFHKERLGGEKFFKLLNKLEQDPARNIDLLELLYLCLALGFRGKYAVSTNGQNELASVRENLYDIIRTHRGEFEPSLSPHWEGLNREADARRSIVPAWMAVSIAILLLAGIFSLWRFSLSGHADPVHARVVGVGREASLVPVHDLAPEPLQHIPDPEPPRFSLARFLAPEIRAGQVTVNENPDHMLVSIQGDGLFESGSERIKSAYQPVLDRISDGLARTTGRIRVIGHSDNVPVRRNGRFGSNFELSQARAESVVEMFDRTIGDTNRTVAEGLGDTSPIADNSSPEGRARNRRVEVIVMQREGGES